MNIFDYYQNPRILSAINRSLYYIRTSHDKEDCRQEIFAELYDFMPITEEDAVRIVNRIASRFRYYNSKILKHETGLTEAGIL